MTARDFLGNVVIAIVLFAATGYLVIMAVEAADKEHTMMMAKVARLTATMDAAK